MIRINVGKLGSGKTISEVRSIYQNINKRPTYTNIRTSMHNQIDLTPDMLIHKNIVDHKKNKKTGETEAVYKYEFNIDFWRKFGNKNPINVVLDEAHTFLNSRRSQTKLSLIMNDFLAMLRRILGETELGYGELVLITHIPRKLDVNVIEMCNQVRYHICNWIKRCRQCNLKIIENSEEPEQIYLCPRCRSRDMYKYNFWIEVFKFENVDLFLRWEVTGEKLYYDTYIVKNIEKYFNMYDTFQLDNLVSGYIS